ncbi:MAG: hypothetical protein GY719_19935 [bacterium]|nr:hypothetical protein [bacterium]
MRARLDVAKPEGKLRPGMFVEVELADPHVREGARATSLVVPEGALVRDGDDLFVFVAAGERRFERRDVRAGRKAGGDVEILPEQGSEGIAPGDAVVVEGAFLLKSAAARESLGGGHDH